MTEVTTQPAKSSKTTAAGVLAILAALLAAAQAHWDGDPATAVNWGALFAAVSTGAGLILSRDWDVSSEGTKVVKSVVAAAKKQAGQGRLECVLLLAGVMAMAVYLVHVNTRAPEPVLDPPGWAEVLSVGSTTRGGDVAVEASSTVIDLTPPAGGGGYVTLSRACTECGMGYAVDSLHFCPSRSENLVFVSQDATPPPYFYMEPRGGPEEWPSMHSCDRLVTTRDGESLWTMHRNYTCQGHRGDPGGACSDEVR